MKVEPGLALACFAGVVFLKSFLLFAAAGFLLFVLRKASAAARAMVWQLCLAALLALPLLSITLPPIQVSVLHRSAAISPIESLAARRMVKPASERSEPTFVEGVSPIGVEPRVKPGVHASATPAPLFPPASSKVPIWLALMCVWSLGVFLLMARLFFAAFRLRRLSTTSSAAPDWITATVREFESSDRRQARILVATGRAAKASPMTWGMRRPIILLPAEAGGWSRERLTPVLLHELGHIARYDWPILLLADLAAIIYWFHPLVWLLRRRLRAECELACDDRVLAHGVSPQEYASLLLDIARTSLSRRPISALSLAISLQSQGGTVLERRLRSVLQTGKCRWPVSRAAAALGMLTLIVTVSPLAAARIAPEITQGAAPRQPLVGIANPTPSLETNGTDARHSPDYPARGYMPDSLRASDPSQTKLGMQDAWPTLYTGFERSSIEPGAAAAIPASESIAWGQPKSGLQAGLRSPGNRKTWRYGDIIEMDYIVRNVSNKPITFQHEVTPGVAGVISDILDSKGVRARTMGLPVPHTAAMQQVTLQPGASGVIGQTRMGLRSVEPWRTSAQRQAIGQPRMGVLPQDGSQNGADSPASNWVEAEPGNYTMRHLDTLTVIGANVESTTLYTGYLPLLIQQPAVVDSNRPSAPVTVQPASATAAKPITEAISWGKSIDGLRAGLALSDGQLKMGKDLCFDLYINNTSKHDISITYIANDDKFIVPDLWNAKREKLKFDWRNPTVEQKIEGSAALKPGESVCVAHPGVNISTWGHDEEAQLNVGTDYTHFVAGMGKYRVRFTAALLGANSTWKYYPSGEITFTLLGP